MWDLICEIVMWVSFGHVKFESAAYNQKGFGALLTGLFKTFDCISQNPSIAKLNAYRFSIDSLRLVQDHLTNRKTKNQNKFSIQLIPVRNFTWSFPGINFRASLIQHLFVWFFIIDDIDFANYADDNTPYTIGSNMEDFIFKL